MDGDTGGQDQQTGVLAFPQGMDDRRHQAQHAARALELLDAGPVVVEAVEEFGVDGVSGFDASLVLGFATLGGKLLRLTAVEIGAGFGDGIARDEERRVGDGLEEPPPHNLEALFRVGWSPGRFQASEDVLQAQRSLASAFATRLGIGGRDGGDYQSLWGGFGGFGQGLGKAQIGIERATGQAGDIVQLARIDHPFIDQDQAGCGGAEDLAQDFRTGADALSISFCHHIVAIFAEQLPGQFAP